MKLTDVGMWAMVSIGVVFGLILVDEIINWWKQHRILSCRDRKK